MFKDIVFFDLVNLKFSLKINEAKNENTSNLDVRYVSCYHNSTKPVGNCMRRFLPSHRQKSQDARKK